MLNLFIPRILPADLAQHGSAVQIFQSIDQPLWLKASVTAMGLMLIVLELWWFLPSKLRSRRTSIQSREE